MMIAIPKLKLNDTGKVKFCTEVAFTALCDQARILKFPIGNINGFEALGDATVQLQFEAACRAVIESLKQRVTA